MDGVALHIRPALAEDVDAIHAIEVASFGDPWKRDGFRDLILGGNAKVVVAETDGRIVGFAVSYSAADEAEIANVAVDASARRAGIGRALVDHLIAESGKHGAAMVFLEVRESNAAARALYRGRGFAELARRPSYYSNPREDAVVMRLDIPGAVF
jgi:ribosomal-protein-alanine acetyltransferase